MKPKMRSYLSFGDEGWEFESSRARREKTCSCGL